MGEICLFNSYSKFTLPEGNDCKTGLPLVKYNIKVTLYDLEVIKNNEKNYCHRLQRAAWQSNQ